MSKDSYLRHFSLAIGLFLCFTSLNAGELEQESSSNGRPLSPLSNLLITYAEGMQEVKCSQRILSGGLLETFQKRMDIKWEAVHGEEKGETVERAQYDQKMMKKWVAILNMFRASPERREIVKKKENDPIDRETLNPDEQAAMISLTRKMLERINAGEFDFPIDAP